MDFFGPYFAFSGVVLLTQGFKELLEVEFARIKKEKTALLMKAQHWTDWWKKSVQKIKQLYA